MLRILAVAAALAPLVGHAQQRCEEPNVLLVVDRSLSMRGEINGQTKWDIATNAISSLLATYGQAARFGLMIYPGPDGDGADGIEGPVAVCRFNRQFAECAPLTPRCSTGEVVVDVGRNTRAAINGALAWPDGLRHSYTPTWQSLEAAANHGSLRDPARRQFVILLTDGYQCCGLFENADGSLGCEPEDRGLIVQKIQLLRQRDITPFVIGFGGAVDVETLQNAAVAAGTARPNCDPNVRNPGGDRHCYYQADDPDELENFLDDIVQRIGDELCDGQDNDCDGAVDEQLRRDCESACGAGTETCFAGRWGDCDAPGLDPEACNGRDDDCDGRTDEGLRRPCNTACGQGEELCRNGNWAECDAPPVNAEVCDGRDNNCDGVVDEGCDCEPGEQRACGDNVGICRAGTQRCLPNGQWGDCEGGQGPRAEVCNGEDDDCDGRIDGLERDCNTACGDGREVCRDGEWSGCDAPGVSPEDCNGQDDDCDGRIDEELDRECRTDCGNGIEVCEGAEWSGCTAREPSDEVCDNGRDEDCDGQTDEGCGCQEGATQPCGQDDGVCESGTQTCRGGVWGACEGAFFGGSEICNGLDDDCDGRVDEGNDLCDADQICACGACADPCQAGECGGNAQCIFGHCIEDHCPDGLVCEEGNCVPGFDEPDGGGNGGELETPPDAGVPQTGNPGAADGCQCDQNGTPGLWWAFLGLLALGRRRSRR